MSVVVRVAVILSFKARHGTLTKAAARRWAAVYGASAAAICAVMGSVTAIALGAGGTLAYAPFGWCIATALGITAPTATVPWIPVVSAAALLLPPAAAAFHRPEAEFWLSGGIAILVLYSVRDCAERLYIRDAKLAGRGLPRGLGDRVEAVGRIAGAADDVGDATSGGRSALDQCRPEAVLLSLRTLATAQVFIAPSIPSWVRIEEYDRPSGNLPRIRMGTRHTDLSAKLFERQLRPSRVARSADRGAHTSPRRLTPFTPPRTVRLYPRAGPCGSGPRHPGDSVVRTTAAWPRWNRNG